MVDASADHVGAALQQRRSAVADWQPLAFFSKKLEPAQMRYSAFDRELFACVAGICHFCYMLDGRPFTIYTDHKPLTFALGKVSEPWTAMQSRQLSYVAEFTTDIQHIPGSENIVADTLSRPPQAALPAAATGGPAVATVAASPVSLDYARIAANQRSCQETLKAAHSSSLQLQHVDMQGERVICDTSTGQPRPLIPMADRRGVFRAIHELAHAGIRATRRLMAARVVWRGMASDVAAWGRDCQLCARGKASPQHTAPVQPIPVPERRFTHVHVDLVGPLPASAEGYLFTMVDRSSRWLEAVPLKSMAAEDCVDVLISAWVARFGVPTIITADQGRQFTSALWAGLTKLLGIKHVQTTAYHPQSNGMVERTHGQLKAALRARLAGSRWPEHLPWVLLGPAPKEDSGVSAAERVCGAALALPAEFLSAEEPPAAEFLQKLQQVEIPATRPLSYAEAAAKPAAALLQASHVYVRRGGTLPPLTPLYVGPYEVLERADKHFRLAVGGREETVSIDRLKPNLGVGPFSAALPAAPVLRSHGGSVTASSGSCY